MTFTLQPVRVGNGSDEDGMLVFDEDRRLLAVLTHLSNQYDGLSGHWYLEAGFGRLENRHQPTFINLEAAHEWIVQRLARRI
ncbi:hypothetical protein VB618_00070 [Microvirga sp. CF3062]|uniref:hypothetical protein n=1 Tax=Microvirga sp. CF3062 TaxID=3110182 RepID=UPI002E75FACA|nr:hypothetical protein [Microvirga sp. CF3062]MEE1654573.1 hypothetical protein [Microvirga sp. CF3062]